MQFCGLFVDSTVLHSLVYIIRVGVSYKQKPLWKNVNPTVLVYLWSTLIIKDKISSHITGNASQHQHPHWETDVFVEIKNNKKILNDSFSATHYKKVSP